MKLKSISIYMLSLAGMLGLWSCSTDEATPEGSLVASGETVPVTITISRGAQTRTELSENTTNGGLNQVWSKDDKVVLYNDNGAEAGTLTLQSGADTSEGIFTGTVTGATGTYRLWYFGKPQTDGENSYPYLDFSKAGQVKLDLEKQNFRNLKDLEAVDILSTDVNIVVKGDQGTVGQPVTMKPHVAMARFTMSGIPDGTSGTVKIYNNLNSDRSGIYARRFLSLSTGEQQGGNGTTASFTYDGVKNGDDIYVAFLPNPYTLHFEFETSDGAKYTHTFGQNNIEVGVYYQSFNKAEGDENGTTGGVEVPVVDHSKNPLTKWAESDLKRTGSGASVKADFASDYTITGSYYQFGRNYGYNSVAEAAQNYGVERSDMASNRNVYAGTGSTSIVSTYYASTIDFSKYPNYFFIDNNHGGDYTAPAHGQEWYDRAKSNGYSYDSPCPDGWRLPTVAEYKEILPVINDKAGNTGNSAWNTLEQFKTFNGGTKDEIKCAFRWSKEVIGNYSYLKIECLVVRTNEDDLKNIDWNDKNIVVRYFKGAGYIQAHRNLWHLTNGGTHYTGRPLEWGTYDGVVRSVGYGDAVVVVSQAESYMNRGGFYWTSDEVQGVFSMIFNSSTGYTLGYYLTQYDRPIGVNIRCVRK